MNEQNIRWEQRFSNYLKALSKLDQAVSKIKQDYPLNEEGNIDEDDFLDDIIKEGLIQRFEYTHELAWNVMKDFLLHEADIRVLGSKDATRAAFAAELIIDGDVWMEMIKSRNQLPIPTMKIQQTQFLAEFWTRIYLHFFLSGIVCKKNDMGSRAIYLINNELRIKRKHG